MKNQKFSIFEKLSTASPPYTLHLTLAAPLPIKPTFLHQKRRSPAFLFKITNTSCDDRLLILLDSDKFLEVSFYILLDCTESVIAYFRL